MYVYGLDRRRTLARLFLRSLCCDNRSMGRWLLGGACPLSAALFVEDQGEQAGHNERRSLFKVVPRVTYLLVPFGPAVKRWNMFSPFCILLCIHNCDWQTLDVSENLT